MSQLDRITWWTAIAAVVVGIVAAAMSGCGAAQTNTAAAQKDAATVVEAAVEGWNLAADACMSAAGVDFDARTAENPALARQCYVVLQPVHDSIVLAQSAVSAWTAADQRNFICFAGHIGKGLSEAVQAFPGMPSGVADAAHVASYAGLACPDAGP